MVLPPVVGVLPYLNVPTVSHHAHQFTVTTRLLHATPFAVWFLRLCGIWGYIIYSRFYCAIPYLYKFTCPHTRFNIDYHCVIPVLFFTTAAVPSVPRNAVFARRLNTTCHFSILHAYLQHLHYNFCSLRFAVCVVKGIIHCYH